MRGVDRQRNVAKAVLAIVVGVAVFFLLCARWW